MNKNLIRTSVVVAMLMISMSHAGTMNSMDVDDFTEEDVKKSYVSRFKSWWSGDQNKPQKKLDIASENKENDLQISVKDTVKEEEIDLQGGRESRILSALWPSKRKAYLFLGNGVGAALQYASYAAILSLGSYGDPERDIKMNYLNVAADAMKWALYSNAGSTLLQLLPQKLYCDNICPLVMSGIGTAVSSISTFISMVYLDSIKQPTADAPGLSAAKFGTEVLLVLSIFPQLTSTYVTGMIDLHE